jgi:hypothetical protein
MIFEKCRKSWEDRRKHPSEIVSLSLASEMLQQETSLNPHDVKKGTLFDDESRRSTRN